MRRVDRHAVSLADDSARWVGRTKDRVHPAVDGRAETSLASAVTTTTAAACDPIRPEEPLVARRGDQVGYAPIYVRPERYGIGGVRYSLTLGLPLPSVGDGYGDGVWNALKDRFGRIDAPHSHSGSDIAECRRRGRVEREERFKVERRGEWLTLLSSGMGLRMLGLRVLAGLFRGGGGIRSWEVEGRFRRRQE